MYYSGRSGSVGLELRSVQPGRIFDQGSPKLFTKRKNDGGDALPNSCSEGAWAENRCQQMMRLQLASLEVYTSPQCPRSSEADRVPTGRKSRHGHVACTGKSSHRFPTGFVEPSEKGSCIAHSHTTMLGVKNSQRQSTKGGRVG